MTLIPESIESLNTRSLDLTFKQRLINLGTEQLRIDIENERDLVKLGLWLEQFGIPAELLPDNLEEFAFREMLQKVLKIYRLSGTNISVCLLAQALQVSEVFTEGDCYVLGYTGEARYDAHFKYDGGKEFRSFVIDIHVNGVREEQKAKFEETFRELFQVFEPVGIFLRDVNFKGVFDNTFYSTFN